ncbi:MAG: hypothetical protein Q9170_005051 [Blastenia crenularia]
MDEPARRAPGRKPNVFRTAHQTLNAKGSPTCTRLNKECLPPTAARKRKAPSQASPATHSARLEERIDDLYSFVKSTVYPAGGLSSPNPRREKSDSAFEVQSFEQLNAGQERAAASGDDGPSERFIRSNSATHMPTPAASSLTDPHDTLTLEGYLRSPDEPSSKDAEDQFSGFRDEMLPHLPFMTLTPTMSARDLRQKYPFLWLCIMAITAKSSSQHAALSHAVRSNLGRLTLVEGEKSLDLMFGTITCLSWGQYYLYNHGFITNLTYLTIALIMELGLNKSKPKDMPHLLLEYNAQGCPEKFCQLQERTMEERRAVIGCFVITSIITNYFSKSDPMRWTPYLEECLKVMSEQKECPGDIHLAQYTRLQLINNRAAQISESEGISDAAGVGNPLWLFYVNLLQGQLKEVQALIAPEMQQNPILQLHFYNTEIKVHEIALSKLPSLPPTGELKRVDSLCTVLEAVRKWFKTYIALSLGKHVRVPLSISTQLAQSIVTLYRLSIFECPGWDRSLVRETCNLTCILDRVIDKFQRVQSEAGSGTDDGSLHFKLYSTSLRKLTSIKNWWQAKEDALQQPLDLESAQPQPAGASIPAFDAGDAWLNEMLMLGDFQFDPLQSYVSDEIGRPAFEWHSEISGGPRR